MTSTINASTINASTINTSTGNTSTGNTSTGNTSAGNTSTGNTSTGNAPALLATSSRSSADALRSLPNNLRSEWIKLTTVRSNGAILGLTLAVSGLISWALGTYVKGEVLTVVEVFTFSSVFIAVFAAVAGVLVFSSEAQQGTLAPALTAQPARSVLAVAKTITAAGFGATLGLVGLLAGYAGATLSGIETGDTSIIVETGAWAIAFTTIAAVLGLGIGMISRHSTAAISGLLVWWLVIENLVSVFLSEKYARFMPFTAGNGLLGVQTGPEAGDGLSALALGTTENALVFGGYALVAIVIGTVLLHRRDNN